MVSLLGLPQATSVRHSVPMEPRWNVSSCPMTFVGVPTYNLLVSPHTICRTLINGVGWCTFFARRSKHRNQRLLSVLAHASRDGGKTKGNTRVPAYDDDSYDGAQTEDWDCGRSHFALHTKFRGGSQKNTCIAIEPRRI